jgi:hypothetical protein
MQISLQNVFCVETVTRAVCRELKRANDKVELCKLAKEKRTGERFRVPHTYM